MHYLFLLYSDETQDTEIPTDPKGLEEYMRPWAEYSQALTTAGVFVGGHALKPTSTATTVPSAR